MYSYILYLTYILICSVHSGEINLHQDVEITTTYCSSREKVCVPKCCGVGKIFKHDRKVKHLLCTDVNTIPKSNELNLNYSSFIKLGSMRGADVIPSKMILTDHLGLTTRYKFAEKPAERVPQGKYYTELYILEDGQLTTRKKPSEDEKWYTNDIPDYCLEIRVVKNKAKRSTELILLVANLKWRENIIMTYLSVGIMVSCFFMFLVLLVYCLLRKLRNLVGYCLMTYIITFITCMVFKEIQFISKLYNAQFRCEVVMPPAYFFMLACFTWSNMLTIQAWSIATSPTKIFLSRNETKKKFWKYSLYAWLIPLAVVGLALGLDKVSSFPKKYKNQLLECSKEDPDLYNYIWVIAPAVLLTLINILFFIKTVKHVVENNKRIKKHMRSDTNRVQMSLGLYIKFSVAMGVSWLLEAIPNGIPLPMYIIVNFYNVFIGIALFVAFICKKKILVALCNKFNITNFKTEDSIHTRFTSLKSSIFKKFQSSDADRNSKPTSMPMAIVASQNSDDQGAKLDRFLEVKV